CRLSSTTAAAVSSQLVSIPRTIIATIYGGFGQDANQSLAGRGLERDRASFDRLRMRIFLSVRKNAPRPEPVEGREATMQRRPATAAGRLLHREARRPKRGA